MITKGLGNTQQMIMLMKEKSQSSKKEALSKINL